MERRKFRHARKGKGSRSAASETTPIILLGCKATIPAICRFWKIHGWKEGGRSFSFSGLKKCLQSCCWSTSFSMTPRSKWSRIVNFGRFLVKQRELMTQSCVSTQLQISCCLDIAPRALHPASTYCVHDLDPCHTLNVALLDAPPMDDDVHSAMDAARSAILADLLSSPAWRIAQRTISPRHGVDPTALCAHHARWSALPHATQGVG